MGVNFVMVDIKRCRDKPLNIKQGKVKKILDKVKWKLQAWKGKIQLNFTGEFEKLSLVRANVLFSYKYVNWNKDVKYLSSFIESPKKSHYTTTSLSRRLWIVKLSMFYKWLSVLFINPFTYNVFLTFESCLCVIRI